MQLACPRVIVLSQVCSDEPFQNPSQANDFVNYCDSVVQRTLAPKRPPMRNDTALPSVRELSAWAQSLRDDSERYELRLMVSGATYDRLGSLADFLGIDDLNDLAAYLLAQAPQLQPPRRLPDTKRAPARTEARKRRQK